MQSKRFLWFLAIVVLVGISTHVLAASFPDTSGTPFVNSFAYLSDKGVISGYPDGTGRPNSFLNRAEALKVVMNSKSETANRAKYYKNNLPPLPLFTDIKQNEWFIPFVEAAYENQVLTGYPDGTLRPGDLLKVEEALALLMRVHQATNNSKNAELSSAIQNRDNEWFTGYINEAIKRNLVLQGNTALRLGEPISRGHYFEMVYRMMRLNETNQLTFQSGNEPRQGNISSIQNPPGLSQVNRPQPANVGHNISRPQPAGSNVNASEKYFSISMPTLGINDLAVIHPQDPFSHDGVLEPLSEGVGHLFSYPGAGGKIMIYGHSSGYPWDVSQYTKIFRRVNELNPGDQIFVTYDGNLYTYEVTFEQAIDAKDTSPFNDNGSGEELILYTCWPPDSIAQRYLVHARMVQKVALN